jgi:tyrosyl-tRNA synthetase
MAVTNRDKILDILNRRTNPKKGGNVFPDFELVVKRLAEDVPLKFYMGIDPTGPDVHIGHSIGLLLLKDLWTLGHKVILLIGDFTARIGDPSDKEAARKALTQKQVEANMGSYIDQISKIIPREAFEVKYNSEWLDKMTLKDIIKLASHVTVQQMLARNMFQERINKEKPIYVHEFLYPLMQGYDSVAMEVDGEVGGNDQTFNMLMGRELEREFLNKDKIVLATRLLINTESGKKISKTEGGFIAVNDSPKTIFEKVMNDIPDEMIKTVFELCTEVKQKEIDKMESKISGNAYNSRDFNRDLAFELVKIYHSEKEAKEARREAELISKGETPEKIEEIELNCESLPIVKAMNNLSLTSSSSEAKRLVDQGAVSVNGQTVSDWNFEVKRGDMVKIGKSRFIKIN